jgi:hypothetical protein
LELKAKDVDLDFAKDKKGQPLLVLSDAGGLEIGESAGRVQTLEAGATLKVALPA